MSRAMVKRGEIFYADLSPVVGCEQGGIRPVIVIQNDIGNRYSPTVIVAAITSQIDKPKLPTHVLLTADDGELVKNSIALLEQVRTIDKSRLRDKKGMISSETMKRIDKAILVSFGVA